LASNNTNLLSSELTCMKSPAKPDSFKRPLPRKTMRSGGRIEQPDSPERLTGLPPIVNTDARLLILGSFPSAASLAARQYYAHPQNRFWLIVGKILGEDLRMHSYRERVRKVRAAGIAIWDVYASCERSGSLDAAIRNPEFNDFAALLRRAPRIARACFNGATAGRAVAHLASFGLASVVLPSTSPANASQPLKFKLERWHAAILP
jgi:hypoxanthine-DNA glycosylase